MIEYYKNLSLEDLFYVNENGLVCQEEWKSILGFEGLYDVSNLGRLKSYFRNGNRGKGRGCFMIKKQRIGNKGYLSSNFRKKNFSKDFRMHRVVATAFIPNPENKPEVNHKGNVPNKTDNRVWMLEWSTSSENKKHARKNGLVVNAHGINHPHSKLTDDDVLEIRASSKTRQRKETAEKYNISVATVWLIVSGKSWKHLL